MDALAYLQYVVSVRCINYENFVCFGHESRSKYSSDHKNNRNVEHKNACAIISEDVRQRLRSEHEETNSAHGREYSIVHIFHKSGLSAIGSVVVKRSELPVRIIVGALHDRRILLAAKELQCVADLEGLVRVEHVGSQGVPARLLKDDQVPRDSGDLLLGHAVDLVQESVDDARFVCEGSLLVA